MKLKDALKGKLTPKELTHLRTSFDVIGSIAIIEIPKELKKREKIIAQTILQLLKNVKTIAVETGEHTGKYRKQKLKIIAGEKTYETQQKESGITLKTNIATCYYSPRLGTERMRIAKQVKEGENILVAGSGIAPYPIIILKHTKAKEITAVEPNPSAHKYAQQNITSNKIKNVTLIKADITKIKLGKYDRIILAIPHEGVKLVPAILKFAKKGTKLHIYDFAYEEKLAEPTEKLSKQIQILNIVKTQQVGTRRYRICIDAILK